MLHAVIQEWDAQHGDVQRRGFVHKLRRRSTTSSFRSRTPHLCASAWTIGIVTNGAGDIQRVKLAATGLADLVDGVAVSGDLEIRKPDTAGSPTRWMAADCSCSGCE